MKKRKILIKEIRDTIYSANKVISTIKAQLMSNFLMTKKQEHLSIIAHSLVIKCTLRAQKKKTVMLLT